MQQLDEPALASTLLWRRSTTSPEWRHAATCRQAHSLAGCCVQYSWGASKPFDRCRPAGRRKVNFQPLQSLSRPFCISARQLSQLVLPPTAERVAAHDQAMGEHAALENNGSNSAAEKNRIRRRAVALRWLFAVSCRFFQLRYIALASHWPRVSENSDISTYGHTVLEMGMCTPPTHTTLFTC